MTLQASENSERLQLVVRDNVPASRYELLDQSDLESPLRSFANYALQGGAVVVPHVETLLPYGGNGFAEQLLAGIVEDLRHTERKIVALCPFAAQYLRSRPETADVTTH